MKKSEVEKQVRRVQNSLAKYAKEEGLNFVKYKPIAVGYLDITEEYQKDPVSQNFINKLRIIWSTGGSLGSLGHHECEFCIDEGNYEGRAKSSSEKILRDEENKIEYRFPQMIFHYIEEHGYQPPEDFILFVLGLDGGKIK